MYSPGGGDGKPSKKGDDEKKPIEAKPTKSLLAIFMLLILLPAVNAIQYEVETFKQEFSLLTGATTLWYGGDGTFDDLGKEVNIGFTFRYFGQDFSKVNVSTNGYITLLDTSISPGSGDGSDYSNDPIPDGEDPDNFLAPWWDDLIVRNQGTTDKVSHKTSGSSPNRVFTVEYKSISSLADNRGSFLTFQVKLYETTNVIEFHYFNDSSKLDFTASATIGIENADGSYGVGGPSTDNKISIMPTLNYRFTPKSENRAPDTPTPISPADDSVVYTSTPSFSWSQFSDPDGDSQQAYRVRVWEDTGPDTDGTLIVLDKEYSGTASSVTPSTGDYTSGGLVHGKHYHWHVRVQDENGAWSSWSADTRQAHMDFSVNLGDGYEPDDQYQDAKTLTPGVRQTHSIHNGGADVDWMKFNLVDYSKVIIETSGPGEWDDTRMWLYNSSGVPTSSIADDDDSGYNLYSKITKWLSPGTFYVKVDEYNNNDDIDTYYLDLTVILDERPTISADASSGSESYNDGVYDWLNAGDLTDMNIDVSASKAGDANELRSVFWRLLDDLGIPVANTQDSDTSPDHWSYDIYTTSDNAGWLDGQGLPSKDYFDFELATHFTATELSTLKDNKRYSMQWRVEENPLSQRYQSTTNYSFKIDRTSPNTSISLNGTSGDSGWYKSNVQVTLSASDSASGVASTKYCTNTSSTCTPTTSYSSAFTIPTEGTSYVHYLSTDNVGNSESTKSSTIKIDKTAPPAPSNIIWDDGATSADTTIVANWGDVTDTSGLVDYYLQVDVDSTDFTSGMIFDGLIGSTSATKTLTSSNGVTAGHVYYYRVRAKNGAGLLGSWSSVSAGVNVAQPNQPPTASFTLTPTSGDTTTTFVVDASSSTDDKDPVTSLQVRWDWENDGTWDTSYTTTKTASHQYMAAGTYTIKLEVKDTGGLTSTTTRQVIVQQAEVTAASITGISPVEYEGGKDYTVTVTVRSESDASGDIDIIPTSWPDRVSILPPSKRVNLPARQSISIEFTASMEKNAKDGSIGFLILTPSGKILASSSFNVRIKPLWAPVWWSGILETSKTLTKVFFAQLFYWNEERLTHFKSGDVDYQWELRRPNEPDVWDWFQEDPNNPGNCTGGYLWTNLPGDAFETAFRTSEEHNKLPWKGCENKGGENEEFQVKVENQSALEPDKVYGVEVGFTRKIQNITIEIDAESEYCGDDWPGCEFLPVPPTGEWRNWVRINEIPIGSARFDWYVMSEKNVTS